MPDLDRTLTAWLDDRAMPRAPEDLLDETLARTSRSRPRPAWRIPERWIPMPLTLRLAVVPRALIYLLLVSLLVTLLAVGGLVVGSLRNAAVTPPSPTGLARNGLIAYSDLGDIWLVDDRGGAPQQLTSGPDLDYPGAWSPDGTQLAYWSVTYAGDPHDPAARERAGRVGRNLAVRIISPGDPEPRTVMSGLNRGANGESDITWAPDGSAIALDHRASPGAEVVEVVETAGGMSVVLVDHAVTPAWSPDGDTIAFVTNRFGMDPDGQSGSSFGLKTVPVEGGEPSPLSRADGNDRSFFWPQWSNDSRQVLFHAGDIFIANADGSGETVVTSTPDTEMHPRWSPGNDRLAFLRHGTDGTTIVVADPDGGNEVVLGEKLSIDHPPVWSPDGRLVLVGTLDAKGLSNGLVVLDVEGIDPAVPIAGPGIDGFGHAAWQRLAP